MRRGRLVQWRCTQQEGLGHARPENFSKYYLQIGLEWLFFYMSYSINSFIGPLLYLDFDYLVRRGF